MSNLTDADDTSDTADTAETPEATGTVRTGVTTHATRSAIVLPIRIVAVLLAVGTLWWAQSFLIPVALSLVVSYALDPLVTRLERWRLPRAVAVPVVMISVIAILGAGLYGLRGQALAFANRLPDGALTIARALRAHTSGNSQGALTRMQQAVKELESAATLSRQPRTDGVTSVRIEEPAFRWNEWVRVGSNSLFEFVARLFAVVCLVYYLLMAGDSFRQRLVRLLGSSFSSRRLSAQILADIDNQIERYLIARALISIVVGLAIWGTFRLLGLAEAGVWGVLAALLFTIPIVGPTMIVAGAGIAALLQFGSLPIAFFAAGLCTAIAALEGNVLAPLLLSRVSEMNAVAVFVSLMFWGWLWGAWGLLLAVPITAAIKAVCERLDDAHPLAQLLRA